VPCWLAFDISGLILAECVGKKPHCSKVLLKRVKIEHFLHGLDLFWAFFWVF
jgi:hypothetical protein